MSFFIPYASLKRLLKYTCVCVIVFIFIALVTESISYNRNPDYGVSFSSQYAQYLGLDVNETFDAIVEEMPIENIRIPIYWDQIEAKPGEFDFSQIDYLMDKAAENNIKVTLAIGLKVPRWPECFIPDWSDQTDNIAFKQSLFQMIDVVVKRYRDHSALEKWQVENEPFFPFGECPAPEPSWFYQEVDFVRMLDPIHQIQSTASGEQSLWFLRARGIDTLGVSLYREVWNKTIGVFIFPHPPIIYTLQRMLVEPFVDLVIISELQMEPWIPEDIARTDSSIEDFYKMFPAEDMQQGFDFANLIGVDEIDLWGVEWWYYMKEHGEDRLWNKAIELLSSQDN